MNIKSIDHFVNLHPHMQKCLLDFINKYFTKQSSFNYEHTAYGLKQRFISLNYPLCTQHITTKCFVEAATKLGFKTQLVPGYSSEDSKNWYFNAHIKTSLWKDKF